MLVAACILVHYSKGLLDHLVWHLAQETHVDR